MPVGLIEFGSLPGLMSTSTGIVGWDRRLGRSGKNNHPGAQSAYAWAAVADDDGPVSGDARGHFETPFTEVKPVHVLELLLEVAHSIRLVPDHGTLSLEERDACEADDDPAVSRHVPGIGLEGPRDRAEVGEVAIAP